MNLSSHTYRIILVFLISLYGMTSCNSLNEDLPECRLFVKFKYDYNLLSADAFHTQVNEVELYVFDKDGKFLFKQSEAGAPLATGHYRMEVKVPVGEYRFMVWAKSTVTDANGNSIEASTYELPAFTPGVSTIEEMKLRLARDPSRVIDTELQGLWYGEIVDVHFTGKLEHTETVNLIKDTNKVRFVFEDRAAESSLDVNGYTYEIIESNGYLAYDNSLLPDDALSYQPYYMGQGSASSGIVELNTMRLMADRSNQFIVKDKQTGNTVFNIDLTAFFLQLRLEEHKRWSDQEYLDRKDEYQVVFFLAGSQNNPWLSVYIIVNGWTWYVQQEEVGEEIR